MYVVVNCNKMNLLMVLQNPYISFIAVTVNDIGLCFISLWISWIVFYILLMALGFNLIIYKLKAIVCDKIFG